VNLCASVSVAVRNRKDENHLTTDLLEAVVTVLKLLTQVVLAYC